MRHVPEPSSFDLAVKTLFSHILSSPTAPTFTGEDGITHNIRGAPTWSTGLGSELCILDIENRQFREEGQTWGPGPFVWDEQKDQAPGVLNHYLYGKSTCCR
jgi:hypothetical protein